MRLSDQLTSLQDNAMQQTQQANQHKFKSLDV